MNFTLWTNEHAPVFFGLLASLLVFGLVSGSKQGGWNRHLPYMFTIVIFIQYFLLSPLMFYSNERRIIIGTDISNYYGLSAFFSCVAVFFFILGYNIIGTKNKVIKNAVKLEKPEKALSFIFYGLYGIVLVNMAVGGINVVNIFVGNETVGLGAKGGTYFLQNFADSLITCIVLAYLMDVSKKKLITWSVLSFFLFTLLGFRYRILLAFIGFIFVYLYKNRLGPRQLVGGLLILMVFLYGVMFLTMNRYLLIKREYAQLQYDPTQFKYKLFFEQTRGSLADMAIYKVYENPAKNVKHDYGMSMFAYIFVRMIPRAFYPDKDDLYPPPQNKVQFAAYDAWWGKYSGESLLSSGCLYVAFGWLGVVLGYLLWGYLLKLFANSMNFYDLLRVGSYIVISLVTFQWITRAYFPQAVDHAVYMLFPIWILRLMGKRRGVNTEGDRE